MLEISETTVIANQMKETILGKTVKEVIVGETPHKFGWFYEPIDQYDTLLVGNTIIQVNSIGSMVEISFDRDVVMILGEGEEIVYFSSQQELPIKHQLLILFDDGTGFSVRVKLYGWLLVGNQSNLFKDILYYRLAKQRWNITSNLFTYQYFTSQIIEPNKKQSVKGALATKQNIPGLGNGTIQDILWQANVNPKTTVSKLSSDEVKILYESIINVTNRIIKNDGRISEITFYGKPGSYTPIMSKNNETCLRCNSLINQENYLGGKIYYCLSCQPIKK